MVSEKFTHNGKDLNNSLTLKVLGFSDKSMIHVGGIEKNLIFESRGSGKCLTAGVSSDDLVGNAINKYKNMIHSEYGLIRFIYNGKLLKINYKRSWI